MKKVGLKQYFLIKTTTISCKNLTVPFPYLSLGHISKIILLKLTIIFLLKFVIVLRFTNNAELQDGESLRCAKIDLSMFIKALESKREYKQDVILAPT